MIEENDPRYLTNKADDKNTFIDINYLRKLYPKLWNKKNLRRYLREVRESRC